MQGVNSGWVVQLDTSLDTTTVPIIDNATEAGSAHSHSLSGNTVDGGGQTTPVPLENRQPYSVQLYIQKIM